MGHLDGHVVDVLLHLSNLQQFKTSPFKDKLERKKVLTLIKAGGAHIVNDQFFFTILPSKLPDTHLDEILESGVHVDILILQLAVTGPELDLLHKPAETGRKAGIQS